RVTPSSRSSRSGDHHRSRRDSPEYDRHEGRVETVPYCRSELSSASRDHKDSFLFGSK
ncbi:hypothetical protein Tco_0276950, partial [Tanacetum coccineum]